MSRKYRHFPTRNMDSNAKLCGEDTAAKFLALPSAIDEYALDQQEVLAAIESGSLYAIKTSVQLLGYSHILPREALEKWIASRSAS